MNLDIDLSDRSVSFELPTALYSEDAVRIAAHVFENRCDVGHEAEGKTHSLMLVAKRSADEAALTALAGDFINELLNQEYRFVVARFNRKIADRIVTQTLLAARGGENPPPAPAESAEFKEQVKKLMAAAEDEIKRTMPKKIAPQGTPIPAEANG